MGSRGRSPSDEATFWLPLPTPNVSVLVASCTIQLEGATGGISGGGFRLTRATPTCDPLPRRAGSGAQPAFREAPVVASPTDPYARDPAHEAIHRTATRRGPITRHRPISPEEPRARFSRRSFPGSPVLAVVLLFLPLSTAAAAPVSFDQARALYDQNKMTEALPLLEQLAARDRHDARVHAWLADTYRRLGRKDEAISAARLALESDSCNSFAHVVLAAEYAPGARPVPLAASDSMWLHLLSAVRCDSTDGNAWEDVTLESIRRGEPALRKRSLRMMVESGHLTPAALAYGRWSLRTLPRNAILITNGDLDT